MAFFINLTKFFFNFSMNLPSLTWHASKYNQGIISEQKNFIKITTTASSRCNEVMVQHEPRLKLGGGIHSPTWVHVGGRVNRSFIISFGMFSLSWISWTWSQSASMSTHVLPFMFRRFGHQTKRRGRGRDRHLVFVPWMSLRSDHSHFGPAHKCDTQQNTLWTEFESKSSQC